MGGQLSFIMEGEKEALGKEIIAAVKRWAFKGHIRYSKDEMKTIYEVIVNSLYEED